jgi:hypothetical protein
MMKTMIAVTLALAALMLGLDKVRNEHRMTEMYERQAVALERAALADEGRLAYTLTNSPKAKLIGIEPTEPRRFDQSTCGPVGADCKANCPGWGRVSFKEGLHFDERFLAKQGALSVRLPEVCR